jgi:hypothetical protein
VKYPFIPKSTTHLTPGQFWAIPLHNHRFACGRVIEVVSLNGKRDLRMFLAGLMDWCGELAPNDDAIAGLNTIEQGIAHIKTIVETGGRITGMRPLELDKIESRFFLSESPGPRCMLMQGSRVVRPASIQEQKSLPVISHWGFNVIRIFAERLCNK